MPFASVVFFSSCPMLNTDVLHQIVSWLDPDIYEDRCAIRNARLVHRTWDAVATPKAFFLIRVHCRHPSAEMAIAERTTMEITEYLLHRAAEVRFLATSEHACYVRRIEVDYREGDTR